MVMEGTCTGIRWTLFAADDVHLLDGLSAPESNDLGARASEDAAIAFRIAARKAEEAAELKQLEDAAVGARIAAAEAACDKQAVHNTRVAHKVRQILLPHETRVQDLLLENQSAFDEGQKLKRVHAAKVVAAEAALRLALRRHKRNADADEKDAAQLAKDRLVEDSRGSTAEEHRAIMKELAIEGVSLHGKFLQHVPGELRADKDVALAALSQDPEALRYVAPKLRDDADVLRAAVAQLKEQKESGRQSGAESPTGKPKKTRADASPSLQVGRSGGRAVKRAKATGLMQPASLEEAFEAAGGRDDAQAWGKVCEHRKKLRQCAKCSPCECTKDKPSEQRTRRDHCPDCCPCACSKEKPIGQRRRKDHCPDCCPCICTKEKPIGQRRRKGACPDCKPCDCSGDKPVGQRNLKGKCVLCKAKPGSAE